MEKILKEMLEELRLLRKYMEGVFGDHDERKFQNEKNKIVIKQQLDSVKKIMYDIPGFKDNPQMANMVNSIDNILKTIGG